MRHLMSLSEAAKQCFGGHVSARAVRRRVAKGLGKPAITFKATRIGGSYFIHPDDAQEFLEAAADPELYRRRQRDERTQKAVRKLEEAGA